MVRINATMQRIGAILLLSLLLSGPAFAAEIKVPETYTTIQEAVDNAADGDTITLADKTHSGEGNHDIEISGKTLTIRSAGGVPENCIIDCAQLGRGFYLQSGAEVTMQGITIRNTNSSDKGGALKVYNSNFSATLCIFENNTARSCGGALYTSPIATLSFTQCLFTGNRTVQYSGGALSISSSNNAAFARCRFVANTAETRGGAVYIAASASDTRQITFTKCSFQNNSAVEYYGGAIYMSHCDTRFVNCIIANNRARSDGGGVRADSSSATFANCTFTGNRVDGNGSDGGAVWYSLTHSSSLDMIFYNCIFWGDQAADRGNEIFSTQKPPVITWSDIADAGYSGSGNISSDPLFVNAAAEDYHLREGSPCIDSGTATDAPHDDYDGYARPAGGGYDMGAYEEHEGSAPGDCPIWVDANGIKHLNGTMYIEDQGTLIIQ